MIVADQDLLSIQQARILAENAKSAQRKLMLFSQEKLDVIVEAMAHAALGEAKALAQLSANETGFGRWEDKSHKNIFACTNIPQALRGLRCVGVISENKEQGVYRVGVPQGVLAALSPVTSPVSTTINTTLIAIKSGNAVIFSPHPNAIQCISRVLDIMIEAGKAHGLPEDSISYMTTVTKSGTSALFLHPCVNMLLLTGTPGLYHLACSAHKPLLYGGTGNGPAFIEKTADLPKAAHDIISSKCFDNGIAASAEQCIIVEEPIANEVRRLMQENGCYFMTDEEAERLGSLFFLSDGKRRKAMLGQPAHLIARRAEINVPSSTRVLAANRKYVSDKDPYSRELLAPVFAFYVENDWQHACEKCLELLFHERNAHTMVIHSRDEEVVRQFALVKPVGRLLVNTPGSFGGLGEATNIFPSMTLGSGASGFGITAENVSPQLLTYTRTVAYGVREPQCLSVSEFSSGEAHLSSQQLSSLNAAEGNSMANVLRLLLAEAVKAIESTKS